MAESTQQKLSKVRPPRVQITYDVETGGEITMRELPFVVGVMADLSAKSEKPLPKMKDRKFVEIDRDNLNDVMESIEPKLELKVENKITQEGGDMKVDLKFKNMDDFNPYNIVQQVPALKKLYEAKMKLEDLNAKMDGNDQLEELLQEVVSNTESLEEIKASLHEETEEPKEETEEPKEETET